MYLEDEYYYYRLAVDLAVEKGFDILHIDQTRKEIWLEQKIGRNSHLIRLAHHSFDWANQLKQDMNVLVQKAQGLRKMLTGKKTIIHSVYIAKFPPVDDWEKLKQSQAVKGDKQMELSLYYLDQETRQEEKNRLFSNISKDAPEFNFPESEWELEQETIRLNKKLQEVEKKQREETESIFFHGKPFFLYFFLAVNFAMFYLLEVNGGSTSPATLIEFGAKYNPAIMEGEWWRIITSMFLHVGFLHLFMNMLALFYLGMAVERIYGSGRFLIIYFLAGIAGGVTSFIFNVQVAAGASGAIFGLFGALLYFGVNHTKLFFRTMGWNLLFIIGLNIVIGITIPQIDNGAHMGGLVGGFLASAIVSLPRNRKRLISLLAGIIYVAGISAMWLVGISQQSNSVNPELQLQVSQQYMAEANYQQAYLAADRAIGESDSYQAELLFYRAYAAIHLEELEQAITDLEKVTVMETAIPEAHYNLALLYVEQEKIDQAIKQAEKAMELRPNNEQFQNLHNRLTE